MRTARIRLVNVMQVSEWGARPAECGNNWRRGEQRAFIAWRHNSFRVLPLRECLQIKKVSLLILINCIPRRGDAQMHATLGRVSI